MKSKTKYFFGVIFFGLMGTIPLLSLYVSIGSSLGIISQIILLTGAVLGYLLGICIFWLGKIEHHLYALVKGTVREKE